MILFFVLSGMVLALPRFAGKKIPYDRYLLARALRLYPVAWAAAGLAVLVFLLVPHALPGSTPWLRNQFNAPLPSFSVFDFIGMVFPFDPTRFDAPLWSLEQELRLSVLLPLLVLLVRRYHAPVMFLVATLLIVEGTASTQMLSSWRWTPVAAGCFLLGILLARHRESLNDLWAGTSALARVLVGLGILLSFWIPERFSHLGLDNRFLFNLIPALGGCALLVAAQGPGLRRRLSTRVPAWLGRISFSLYVVHFVVLRLLLGLAPGVPVIDIAPAGIALSRPRNADAALHRGTGRRAGASPCPTPELTRADGSRYRARQVRPRALLSVRIGAGVAPPTGRRPPRDRLGRVVEAPGRLVERDSMRPPRFSSRRDNPERSTRRRSSRLGQGASPDCHQSTSTGATAPDSRSSPRSLSALQQR